MFEFWTDPFIIFLIGIAAIVVSSIAIVATLHYERVHRNRHRELLAATGGKNFYFEKFEVVQDIHNLQGESTRITSIRIVNASDTFRKRTSHPLWSTQRAADYEVWAEANRGKRLETEIVTDTASYTNIAVKFPNDGIPPHQGFSYKLFARNKNGFPNLLSGEWCDASIESRVYEFSFRILMPPEARLVNLTCKRISGGETTLVKPFMTTNRAKRQEVLIRPKAPQEGVLYKVEFQLK